MITIELIVILREAIREDVKLDVSKSSEFRTVNLVRQLRQLRPKIHKIHQHILVLEVPRLILSVVDDLESFAVFPVIRDEVPTRVR